MDVATTLPDALVESSELIAVPDIVNAGAVNDDVAINVDAVTAFIFGK